MDYKECFPEKDMSFTEKIIQEIRDTLSVNEHLNYTDLWINSQKKVEVISEMNIFHARKLIEKFKNSGLLDEKGWAVDMNSVLGIKINKIAYLVLKNRDQGAVKVSPTNKLTLFFGGNK